MISGSPMGLFLLSISSWSCFISCLTSFDRMRNIEYKEILGDLDDVFFLWRGFTLSAGKR